MKTVEHDITIKLGAFLIACAVLYSLGAWSIWVIQCFTGVRGSTFWMSLFFLVISHILPRSFGGLPMLILSIATLYIWIFL